MESVCVSMSWKEYYIQAQYAGEKKRERKSVCVIFFFLAAWKILFFTIAGKELGKNLFYLCCRKNVESNKHIKR